MKNRLDALADKIEKDKERKKTSDKHPEGTASRKKERGRGREK